MTDQPALLRPDDHADRAPDSAAVVVPTTGQRISYRTMVDQSKRLANVLREHGLRPGDHVAIFMTNVPEYFEVVWAARRAGYFYTAISWHLTPGEVRYMLENSQSKALIVSADLADVAEQAVGDRPEPTLRLLVGPAPPRLGRLRRDGGEGRDGSARPRARGAGDALLLGDHRPAEGDRPYHDRRRAPVRRRGG